MSQPHIFTVSELNRKVKGLLEGSFPIIWVGGEISNFTWHSSGHMYFTIKDRSAQLRCVMWKEYNQHLLFAPREGHMIQVQGKISLYEKGGQYQLLVYQMEQQGVGDLRLAFERLAARLRDEGLFDPQHKKALPRFPERVAVVTSPTGAAIQDIAGVISRRFPSVRILLAPVAVQGDGAAGEIVRALAEINRTQAADVIVVGRGGGSPEDLWAFNEEIVARAVFASRIPVVSAVGHEIDMTISDLVADLRAPTPSAAGEFVVPDRREVTVLVHTLRARMNRAAGHLVNARRKHLEGLRTSHGMRRSRDLIDRQHHALQSRDRRLRVAARNLHEKLSSLLRSGAEKLTALDPTAVLSRGYSICRRLPDGSIVTNAGSLEKDDTIAVTMARGSIEGSVTRIRTGSGAR
jgi:exodeoxyribonuclease VII large subunit